MWRHNVAERNTKLPFLVQSGTVKYRNKSRLRMSESHFAKAQLANLNSGFGINILALIG